MSQWKNFWTLVELGKNHPNELRNKIEKMSESELVGFYWTWEESVADLKDERLTRHLPYPRSEDVLDDVAQYIVSQGLDYYEDIMTGQTKMPADPPSDTSQFEWWTAEVMRVYKNRYGAPIRFPDEPPPLKSKVK